MVKKNTLIILAVFVVLLVGFIILNKSGALIKVDPTATPQPKSIDFSDKKVEKIELAKPDEDMIVAELVSPLTWAVTTHPDAQITAGNIEEIVAQLSGLTIITDMSDVSDLESMGLKNPTTITFHFSDSSQLKFEIGKPTPINNGYYVKIDEAIFVLPIFGFDRVFDIFQLAIFPPTPTAEILPDELIIETPEYTPTPMPETGITETQDAEVQENTATPTP